MISTRPTVLTLAWASGRALMSNPGSGNETKHGGRVFLQLRLSVTDINMATEVDNSKSLEDAGKSRNESRSKKRLCARGSQTDNELLSESEREHGCSACNLKLSDIQSKLDKMLSILPEIQGLKNRVKELEEEKQMLKESLELTQVEVEKLKSDASATEAKLTSTTEKISKVDELERRLVKQECFNRRNNIKFFSINDREQELPEDTEKVLRKFLYKEMKISSDDLNEIEFERVHRIPTRPSKEKKQHLLSSKTRNSSSHTSSTYPRAKSSALQMISRKRWMT